MAKKCFEVPDEKWNKVKGCLIAEFGNVEIGINKL